MQGPPTPLAYSIVIATDQRPAELRGTLASIANQSRRPARVVVVDASPDTRSRDICAEFEGMLPLQWLAAEGRSSARQRNQGAALVDEPLITFVDDDVLLPPGIMASLAEVFDNDSTEQTGGVAARIEGMAHRMPRGMLRWYYRLQAGFAHRDYGARLIGPAINCLPSYSETDPDLIPGDWLNSTCTMYRTALFRREQFPEFDGYSPLEDVHLSARIARTHRLYFHKHATYTHLSAPSGHKRDHRGMARMKIANQRLVARDVMGQRGWRLASGLALHRLFVTAHLLRTRPAGWCDSLRGTWSWS
jgi:GT2 family glycosyltransferase